MDSNQLNFDVKKVSVVDILKVRPNTWNPKDDDTKEYAVIEESIRRFGQRIPIVVREVFNGSELMYEIIDGEQRFNSCKNLGYSQIIIYSEGVIDDKLAKELTIWYEQRVPFNEIKLADLIADLVNNYSDAILPYDQQQIDEYLKMNNFDWEGLDPEGLGDAALDDGKTISIKCTKEQYNVISQAIDVIALDNPDVSEGRALVLIAADFISGQPNNLGQEDEDKADGQNQSTVE